MSVYEYKKLRLSIENAGTETRRYLEEKRELAEKSSDTILGVIQYAVLDDLLRGIHAVSHDAAENDHYGIIRNNHIEALATEFPDLILTEKK